MKESTMPNSDSIQALAEFWDTHDLTDFEDELEEVVEPEKSNKSSNWLKPKECLEKNSYAAG